MIDLRPFVKDLRFVMRNSGLVGWVGESSLSQSFTHPRDNTLSYVIIHMLSDYLSSILQARLIRYWSVIQKNVPISFLKIKHKICSPTPLALHPLLMILWTTFEVVCQVFLHTPWAHMEGFCTVSASYMEGDPSTSQLISFLTTTMFSQVLPIPSH